MKDLSFFANLNSCPFTLPHRQSSEINTLKQHPSPSPRLPTPLKCLVFAKWKGLNNLTGSKIKTTKVFNCCICERQTPPPPPPHPNKQSKQPPNQPTEHHPQKQNKQKRSTVKSLRPTLKSQERFPRFVSNSAFPLCKTPTNF